MGVPANIQKRRDNRGAAFSDEQVIYNRRFVYRGPNASLIYHFLTFMKTTELISWGQAHALLREQGLGIREARLALREIPDVKHRLHTRKRWRAKDVLAFAEGLKQGDSGKGGDVLTAR